MFEFPGSNRHMKQNIRSFLFGTSLPNDRIFNLAWLLFRLHIGISIAFSAGLPKMTGFSAPDWFVKQVAEIGFTFPSPALWATLAAWGEFFGGILIAIGLFTRFAALQLAFQFFVISYIWYNEPAPITGMYLTQMALQTSRRITENSPRVVVPNPGQSNPQRAGCSNSQRRPRDDPG